jgi:hypothetical protein
MDLLIDGQRVNAHVSSDMAKRWVTINGQTMMLTKTSGAKQGVRHDHAGGLIAPNAGSGAKRGCQRGRCREERSNLADDGSHEDGNPHSGFERWRGQIWFR